MRVLLAFFLCWSLAACTSTTEELAGVEQGYVLLQFDVNEQGETENITVLESSHNGFFDKEAVTSLKKWIYSPKVVNGQPARDTGKKVKLDFQIVDN